MSRGHDRERLVRELLEVGRIANIDWTEPPDEMPDEIARAALSEEGSDGLDPQTSDERTD